eukprot:1642901-Prorocentrum_lima.AAC.1
MDPHLDKRQCGFRAGRGTTYASQGVRRAAEMGEATMDPVYLMLLDWGHKPSIRSGITDWWMPWSDS